MFAKKIKENIFVVDTSMQPSPISLSSIFIWFIYIVDNRAAAIK